MPQAIVDPDELRQFAQNLKKFSTDMQTRINLLGGQLATRDEVWQPRIGDLLRPPHVRNLLLRQIQSKNEP